jgi:hypothetical protein
MTTRYSAFRPWRSPHLTPGGQPLQLEGDLVHSPRTGTGPSSGASAVVRQQGHRLGHEASARLPVAQHGLAEPRLEKALDQKRVEVDIPLKSEVAGVDEVDIGIFEVFRIRQRTSRPEE